MRVFVGSFDISAVQRGVDREAVGKAMAETGLRYTETRFIGKGEKKRRLKIWLVDRDGAAAQKEVV